MPTPASGTISMNDMRTEINRATGSAIGMDEMRTRYGGSGAISFSDLYNSEGFIVTCGRYTSKFVNFDGWWTIFAGVGSVNPAESNNSLQVAANSFVISVRANGNTSSDTAFLALGSIPGAAGNNAAITTGFRGTNITRLVTANTSRSITASSNDSVSFAHDIPSSGTIHCLIKC